MGQVPVWHYSHSVEEPVLDGVLTTRLKSDQPRFPCDDFSLILLDGRPSVVQRAPLEAIELQSGAGSEELRFPGRTGDTSESWGGGERHVSQVCTDIQSMSAAEAGRPSERIGKGD